MSADVATPATFARPWHLPFHEVAAGRLFARHVAEGTLLVGVVELPATWKFETLRPARLTDKLWVDPHEHASLESRDASAEADIGSLVRQPIWRPPAALHGMEMLVRRSALTHVNHNRAWAAVAALADPAIPATPVDGLYALDASGLRLIDADPHIGESLTGILRKCLWGPNGAWGLAHTMEIAEFERFAPAEQARHARRDPAFASFVAQMAAAGARLPDAYTQPQLDAHEAVAARITERILVAERMVELSTLAHALRPNDADLDRERPRA